MWAHYADDSNGVCIVLDKRILDSLNQKKLKGIFHKNQGVSYSLDCSINEETLNKPYSSAKEFVRMNYKEVFFKKHKDWSRESEARFLVELPEFYLDINGAIKYIVLGSRLKDDEHKVLTLLDMMITPGTTAYHYLTPYSFAGNESKSFWVSYRLCGSYFYETLR